MTQSLTIGAVPTGPGAQVRADFNASDQCLATDNAGANAPTVTYPFMYWRRTTDNNLYRRNSGNSGWEVVEYVSGSNPTTGDDTADGFVQRSLWINTNTKKLFWCLDPAAGAAVWAEVTVGGGGGGGGSVSSVFNRTGAVVAQTGDYTAAQITETSGQKLMTAAERTKLANINTYWTSRTSTDPAVEVKNTTLGAHDMRKFLIYFGVPYNINGLNDSDQAAGYLARYDDVVLGVGLQDPANGNYSTTTSIISKVAALSPNTTIWGYIDVGVNSPAGNYSLSTLQTYIDQWLSIGAKGIFCARYGYDWGVTRTRQNSVLDYIHSKNTGAMMNALTITDALSPSVVTTYNPSGTATHADSRDAYLLESWVFNSDSIASPYFATLSDVTTRGDAARTWRTTLGVRMYASNILLWTGQGQTTLDNYRGISEGMAHIYRLDGSGVMLSLYSASGSDVSKVKPYYPKILSQPGGRPTAAVKSSSTELEATDLGIVVHYESGNYSWTAPGVTISGGGGGSTSAPPDSGLIPTSVQTANGNAPNAERVMIKGSCSSVSLLLASTQRCAQLFMNQTTHSVTFTSSEAGGIFGYASGYVLGPYSSVTFVRDPDNNQWIVPSA